MNARRDMNDTCYTSIANIKYAKTIYTRVYGICHSDRSLLLVEQRKCDAFGNTD